ncbi:hypothetical protein C8R45DRAFT_1037388 [Mycena sanguinolenta]|nr:hypothetical protein C8R45DRAFT_1037388 [Mycena sanguinolenta]
MQSFLLILIFQDMKARTIVPVPDTCGNSSDTVPLFATVGGIVQDFVLTTSITDVTSLVGRQSFTFLGVSARVFPTQETSTMPLYLVYLVQNGDISDHLYTMSETERDLALEIGYRDGGITAYIYPTPICGSIPYYRLYDSAATEHFYTVSEAEQQSHLAAAAWSDEGIVGYVLPPNCTE